MFMRPKSRTGIEGLDNALNGGIPLGNTVLLTGSCGSGKTTISMEFLINGAKRGENGLFISVTEPSIKLLDNMRSFEFFDEMLIDQHKVTMVDLVVLSRKLGLSDTEHSLEEIDILLNAIDNIVRELNIKRVVLDSVTGVCYQLDTLSKIRDFVFKLGKSLAGFGATTILISEIAPDSHQYSAHGVEEAIADGIVKLGNLERRGDLLRTLQIIKMRGTMHSRAKYVMDLTPHGLILVPLLKWGSSGRET